MRSAFSVLKTDVNVIEQYIAKKNTKPAADKNRIGPEIGRESDFPHGSEDEPNKRFYKQRPENGMLVKDENVGGSFGIHREDGDGLNGIINIDSSSICDDMIKLPYWSNEIKMLKNRRTGTPMRLVSLSLMDRGVSVLTRNMN